MSITEAVAAESALPVARATGLRKGMLAGVATYITALAHHPGHSREIVTRPEDTLNHTDRVMSAREPLAAMTMVENRGAIRHEEARAWAERTGEAAELTAVVDTINQSFVLFKELEILEAEGSVCDE